MSGYIKLYRKFFYHDLWKEKRTFSKAESWIDLVALARFQEEPENVLIKGSSITINRGQIAVSIRFLASRWGWSNNKVLLFLSKLEDEKMVKYEKEQWTGVITILNYSKLNPLKKSKRDNKNDPKKRDNERDNERDNKRDNESPVMTGLSEDSGDNERDNKRDNKRDKYKNKKEEEEKKRDVALTCDDSKKSGQYEKKDSSHTVQTLKDEIEKVYKSYPTVCPVTGKRTGKSSKDKDKIKTLLKIHTSDELLAIIELYVLEVKRDGFKQIKNFKTFLNNLPDYGDELETIGSNGTEGLSFSEGELIEIEKLNRLYKSGDKLIVWGISFREFGEYGGVFIGVQGVKDLIIKLKAGTAAYKFLDEFSLGGKVIKPYSADSYGSKKHELDADYLKIEEVENYFLERSGNRLYAEGKNYVRALLFKGEADVWLCKELIDFTLRKEEFTLSPDIFEPKMFNSVLLGYERELGSS